jgi:hypothetical protein
LLTASKKQLPYRGIEQLMERSPLPLTTCESLSTWMDRLREMLAGKNPACTIKTGNTEIQISFGLTFGPRRLSAL